MTLEDSAARGLAWITELGARLDAAAPPLLQTLYIASALCGDVAPDLRPDALAAIRMLRGLLARAGAEAWQGSTGATMLLCYVVDRRLFAEPLPALEQYATAAAAVLSSLESADAVAAFLPAALVLERLGHDLPAVGQSSLPETDFLALITADSEVVRAMIRDIETASRFGQLPVAAPPDLAPVLEAHLMRALGDYHLELAATLLRGLTYLHRGRTLATQTAVASLRANQADEGYFGYFDPEIRLMHTKVNDPLVELRLLDPTLLACLWALAEFEIPHYRLYRDLCAWDP